MKLIVSLGVMVAIALLAGCATENKVAAVDPANGHWVTLEPELGSHVSRRVWVADGSTNGVANSQVKTMSGEGMRDMQRSGNVTSGRPGQ